METKTLNDKEENIQKIQTFLKKEKIIEGDFELVEVIILTKTGTIFIGKMMNTEMIGTLKIQMEYMVFDAIRRMGTTEEEPINYVE